MTGIIEYYSDLNINGNEIKDVVVDKLLTEPTKSLKQGQIVSYNGTLYIAKTAELDGETPTGYYLYVPLATGGDAEELANRVGALETTVGDENSGLVKDVDDLQTTVGDANSGLVKGVADNATAISTLNGKIKSTVADSDNEIPTSGAVVDYVATKVASAYIYKGTYDTLALLNAAVSAGTIVPEVGWVYNIATKTNPPETDSEGHTIDAGDNVACLTYNSSTKVATWDVLGGTIDLSGYATTAQLSNGDVTKIGKTAVGAGTTNPQAIYIDGTGGVGTPTAITATVGSATTPIYMNAGVFTAGTAIGDAGYLGKEVQGSETTVQITTDDTKVPTSKAVAFALDKKVNANADITGATKCKITYDAKGLVTAGADLGAEDIPTLTSAKISDFATAATQAMAPQFVEIALNAASGVSVSGNTYTITTTAMPYGVMVLRTSNSVTAQVFVETRVTANSIVLVFNEAITASEFKVTYILKPAAASA